MVDILSLSPRDAFFKPLSWSIQTGVDRQWTGGSEHRVAQVNGGIGATRTLGAGNLLYGLTTARLEYNHGYAAPAQPAVGLRAGLLLNGGPLTFNGEVATEKFANGETRTRVVLGNNLYLSRQQALHLELQWRNQQPEHKTAIGLRYQYYY